MPSRTYRPALPSLLLVFALAACTDGAPPPRGDGSPELPANPEARTAFEGAEALWADPGRTVAMAEEAIDGYARAAELEPDFFPSHARLAEALAWAHQNWDRSPDVAQRALAAAERAVELAPDRTESHAALGSYYYRIAKDYPAALEHYGRASELAPEDPYPARMAGYVARRANRWEDAVELLEKARALGANRASEWDLGNTYSFLGRFDEARDAYRRAQALEPDHWQPPHALVWVDIDERGDVSGLREYLAGTEGGFSGNRWWLAMVDGDWEGAMEALQAEGADPLSGQYGITPRALLRGLAQRRMGDEAAAMASFQEAREMMQAMVAESPEDPRTHLALGLSLAALGLRDEAVAAGQRGLALMPPERDAMIGAYSVWWMAEIHATAGDADGAFEMLEVLGRNPKPSGWAGIRMDQWLHTIADDPRWGELTAGG